MSARPILYIGNKRYSTWSLRAWLALRRAGIDVEERIIPLDTPEFAARMAPASPTGMVPALHAGGLIVWDSLAIAEWAAERTPGLWPRDPARRATARALVATMHAGFPDLRREASMNLARAPRAKPLSDAARRDVALIEALWRAHRTPGGRHFFGDWSIVDAFWTPIATRFCSYAVDIEPAAKAYADTLLGDTHYQSWRADALAETFPHPLNDDI
jgi:glutathione S-transferase